jgi:hypothetical protein
MIDRALYLSLPSGGAAARSAGVIPGERAEAPNDRAAGLATSASGLLAPSDLYAQRPQKNRRGSKNKEEAPFRTLRHVCTASGRIERISPDATIMKIHSLVTFRPVWWKFDRFEVVHEVLGRTMAEQRQYGRASSDPRVRRLTGRPPRTQGTGPGRARPDPSGATLRPGWRTEGGRRPGVGPRRGSGGATASSPSQRLRQTHASPSLTDGHPRPRRPDRAVR